jgi:hypothetical protein
VREAYLRPEKYRPAPLQNRAHFVAVCALLMRQILTGYGRTRRAAKRGGGGQNLTLDDASADEGPACRSAGFKSKAKLFLTRSFTRRFRSRSLWR